MRLLLDTDTQDTLLTWAARHGQAEAVRLLLEAGASVGATNGGGHAALYIACQKGHLPWPATAPSSATHAVASSSAHAAASSADAAAFSAALAPCSEVAPPAVPAGRKGRPPPGSACAVCHEKKLRCVRLPGGSCEYCVSNGLACVRRGSSGGNCSVTAPCCSAYRGIPLKLETARGGAR